MPVDYPDWSNPTVPGRFALGGTGHTDGTGLGSAVPLRASTSCVQVSIQADLDNAGTVYVGISTVTGDNASLTGGRHLDPGGAWGFPESDLAHVYIVGAAGDGVSYAWFTVS